MTPSYFDMVMPRCKFSPEGVQVVDILSPYRLRKAVERFAFFFRREGEYDFVGYEAESPGESKAILFSGGPFHYESTAWVAVYGFDRGRQPLGFLLPDWRLAWVWAHPYIRGRFFAYSWKEVIKLIGKPFWVEPPLSPAMRRGLWKMGYRPNKRKVFICGDGFPPSEPVSDV